MKTLHRVLSLLVAALGLVHAAFTPAFYDNLLAPDAVWFLGAGLGLFFLGLFNFSLVFGFNPPVRTICVLCDVVALAFALLTTVSTNEPQAYLVVILIMLVTVSSVMLKPSAGAGLPRTGVPPTSRA
jgi:hypothetical protein